MITHDDSGRPSGPDNCSVARQKLSAENHVDLMSRGKKHPAWEMPKKTTLACGSFAHSKPGGKAFNVKASLFLNHFEIIKHRSNVLVLIPPAISGVENVNQK